MAGMLSFIVIKTYVQNLAVIHRDTDMATLMSFVAIEMAQCCQVSVVAHRHFLNM